MAEKLAVTTSRDQAPTDKELRTLEGIPAKLGGQGATLPWPLFRFTTEVMATARPAPLQRNGGSSKERSLRECSPASWPRSSSKVAIPMARCSPTARW